MSRQTTAEILERAAIVKDRLDRLNAKLEADRAAAAANQTIALNPLDELLEELQILASTVIMNEIEDHELRGALTRFARKFEDLDLAMAAGMPAPAEWKPKQK